MSFGSGISWSNTHHKQGFWPRINCSQMKLPNSGDHEFWNHEMLGSPVLIIKSKIDSDLPMILCQLEIIKFIHKLMIVSKLNRSLTRLFIKWLIHRQFLKFLRTKQRHFIAIDFHWIAVQHQIKISVVTFFVLIIFAISIFPQD